MNKKDVEEAFIKELEQNDISFCNIDDWIDDNLSSVLKCVTSFIDKHSKSFNKMNYKNIKEANKKIIELEEVLTKIDQIDQKDGIDKIKINGGSVNKAYAITLYDKELLWKIKSLVLKNLKAKTKQLKLEIEQVQQNIKSE